MRNIVVLAFEGAQVLDITGPMEVFSTANQFTLSPSYRIDCVAAGSGPVTMSNGLSLNAIPYARFLGKIDTIVVPGGSEEALVALSQETKFRNWLAKRLATSRRVVSVCTGAFVLAELGVLKGRRASTHWSACDRLQQFSPTTRVDADAIFTKDGSVYTSAGVTAGIDLALSLVEEDLGREVSLQIARNLVLYLRRSGGQSQFSVPLDVQSESDSRMGAITDYIRRNVNADLTVNTLANTFALSARHLSRLFVTELGVSPARYVTKARLDVARSFLEETSLPLKQIAEKSGYRSTDALSRVFRDQFGVTPDQYRSGFS